MQNQGMKESEVCNFIGWMLVALGLISGLIFIFTFGQIVVPSEYYGTKKVWSGTMIFAGIGIMFNGFIVGYLFRKISSLLRYHEQKS